MQDKVNYADGWNIVTGRELVDMISIKVIADGKEITRSRFAPHTLNPRLMDEKKMIAAGAYARIDNAYINEERYNLIKVADLTPEERDAFRAYNRQRAANRREHMTPAEREQLRKKWRNYWRKKHGHPDETPT